MSRNAAFSGSDHDVSASSSVRVEAYNPDRNGRSASVMQNHTGGTVSFDGTVSSTSASDGINLQNNTNANINFTQTLTLNTSASGTTAFNATGGGTITATSTGSTINSGAGTAL